MVMTALLMEEVRYMIIYISSEENEKLLNKMSERHEWECLTAVFHEESLLAYITEKLQVIQDLAYMVLERSCIEEKEEELEEVIVTIQSMYDTQVIILEDELTNDNGENKKVIYKDLYTSLYKYQEDLERNLEYLLTGERIPEELVYDGIWIGIMTSNSGAGATDFAIGLTSYIHSKCENVCYVEANESGDLAAMASFYGMEKMEEEHYVRDNIDYWHQSVDRSKKYVVLDLGKFNATKLQLFNQCRIKVLITDAKPYRMADAMTVYRYINDDKTMLCLNFANPEEYRELREQYLSEIAEVYQIGHHREIFSAEGAMYPVVMKDYIEWVPDIKQNRIMFMLPKNKLKAGQKKKNAKNKTSVQEEAAVEVQEETDQEEDTLNAVKEPEMPEDIPEETWDDETEPVHEAAHDEEAEEPLEDDIEEVFTVAENEREESREPEVQEEQIQKKKAPVKNLLLMLCTVIMAVVAVKMLPQIKNLTDTFSFNSPDQEEAATELVDAELNINPDIKISVLEVEGADGYEVSYSTDKKFEAKTTVVVEVETADKAVESLAAGKTYYVRVRAFKFNEDGTKVYGEYTEVQEIET